MARRYSEIVIRVYPNGTLKKGPDVVEFHSPDQVVFMMWLVETLSDLHKTFLKNIRLPERTHHQDGLQISCCAPRQIMSLQVFWLINDEHVQTMFKSHERILTDQVM
ncbi:hypothetical protein PIB30_001049 [Stylosanthes scabra]|uniref:Uncharacterized protein n=1 Tax=Stylosanthes scabra TaxID=79078 RepID=A0ABU6T3C9_9FABA|nr:hypothetical protein [Stylosanthes scabra]